MACVCCTTNCICESLILLGTDTDYFERMVVGDLVMVDLNVFEVKFCVFWFQRDGVAVLVVVVGQNSPNHVQTN